jgi:arylsulfatase A-like enzyme
MKAIMVMYDSLNRHMLPPYGCDWTHAPNFARLAARAVTFDRSYVCSMPCMPARRELHTARPNFLHRSWGPIEPFDDSVPAILHKAGVHTHLASDHYHYWEDGGATYHTRYSTWEFFRGQEGDPWYGLVKAPELTDKLRGRNRGVGGWELQDRINRSVMHREADHPQPQTFAAGLDFIRRNVNEDNWFVQIETFDPHEPFFSHRRYKDLYPFDHAAMTMDWPMYGPVTESPEECKHMRYEYAALLSQCDAHLGDVLDIMDLHDLWRDTMLIVWTDHGFMLGEHNYWAKIWMPFFEEVAHTPFFVWDPRSARSGERRSSLVQPALDVGPTLLDLFGVAKAPDMLGQSLAQTVADDRPVREAGIFGMHGAQVNVTDGRYVYMRAPATPDNTPLYNYTVMPTAMRGFQSLDELRDVSLAPPFSFTKGCPTLRQPTTSWIAQHGDVKETRLYDLAEDPGQTHPIENPEIEAGMIGHLTRLMRECDAPPEQFERLGLKPAP